MKTILRSEKKEVEISDEGVFIIIGENINPAGRKKLTQALLTGDDDFIRDLAIRQVQAGADILDINVDAPGADEVSLLPRIALMVAATVDTPICLDSANPNALAAALAVLPGKPLVNSVHGEEKSLEQILPVIKEYGATVVALILDDDGIPKTADGRLKVAGKILERASRLNIPTEDIIVDPIVLTVGADSQAANVTLKTIELVRKEFGVNITLGASNVSFGMPERPALNQTFLALAMGAGATCAITDPMKLGLTIRSADLLLGRDDRGRRFLTYWRAMQSAQAGKTS